MEENEELVPKLEDQVIEDTFDELTENIGNFLDYSFRESDGRQEGYFMHTTEYLKKKKEGFVSEFHHLVEKRIDELKEEKLRCETLLVDLTNSESTFVEKIKLRLNLCLEYISDLQNEKELSKTQEGLVKKILVPYEVGYDLGMNDYLNDNAFLNPIKRL
jgi:hypothetical protein